MRLEQHITRDQYGGNMVETVEREEYFPSEEELRHARADKQNQVLWYIVGVLESLLLLRFIFHLFGANQRGFADLLYSITDPLTAMFRGIFNDVPLSGAYFDTPALTAMLIYALLGMGIAALIDLMVRPTRSIPK